MMKLVIYLAVLAAGLLIGCTSARSVLNIVPQEPFSPQSEAELLSELNAQLPFGIPTPDFIAKQKSGTFVGWAVARTDDQKETVKAGLAQSTTLRLHSLSHALFLCLCGADAFSLRLFLHEPR